MRLLRGAARRLCAAASPGFPRGVEELTPAWATQALLDGGHLSPSERVASVSAVPMGAGVGLASSMARLSLGIEGGAGPARRLSCVAKFPPPAGSAARVAAERMGAFAREVGFYRAVAASEGGGGNGNHGLALPLGVPAALFAGHSPPCGSALLLLEDLSPAVWSGGDQVAGATPSQAAAVVSAAAALHARFWGDPRLRGGWARTWLPALDGAQAPGWDAAGFDAAWPAFRAAQPAAVAALPPACVAALDAGCFAHAAAALLARLGGGGGLPVTLLHGDLRLDNALFRTPSPPSAQPGGGGPPGEVALIDLGDCAAGRGAFDVAYFLSMSLAPGLRSALERPLLGHYAAALRTAGVAVDEAELWEEYRCGAAYSLALAVSLNASAGAAAGEAPGGGAHPRRRALAAAVAARVAAALVETGAEALLR